ncbi:MAG: SYNERG-CTERM sorting domain-containing protein [Synergistaceae bacterium]|jgi:Synergist-CTERM protein sorting domain-containing protein|nr:SYNERG-CTERM sorting domain-containing protein [Synergistaceae bacterium]
MRKIFPSFKLIALLIVALLALASSASAAANVNLYINGGAAVANGATGLLGGIGTWNNAVVPAILTLTAGTTTDYIRFVGTDAVKIEVTGSVAFNVTGNTPIATDYTSITSNLTIIGSGSAPTLTLVTNAGHGLAVNTNNIAFPNVIIQDITLNATGAGSAAPGYGYAGIWAMGDLTITNAIVNANATSSGYSANPLNERSPAMGIVGLSSVTIDGASAVTATGTQTAATNGGRAAGIFSGGPIQINNTATVTATATSSCAAAAGIYSEAGNVAINTSGLVSAAGTSNNGSATENQGTGIAAGGTVAVGTNANVTATGNSAASNTSSQSAGIAGGVTDWQNNLGAGGVTVAAGATVSAEGNGPNGYGIATEDTSAGTVNIATGATVTATGHGDGYAISARTVTSNGNVTTANPDNPGNIVEDNTNPGAPANTVTITPQTADSVLRGSSKTFTLHTDYPSSTPVTLVGAGTGITLSPATITTMGANLIFTIATTSATPTGTYNLQLRIGGVTWPLFDLTVTLPDDSDSDSDNDDATQAKPEDPVLRPADIVSVAISGTTVTVTYSDGTTETHDTAKSTVTITYPESNSFAMTTDLTFTAVKGAIIPKGSNLNFTATETTGATAARAAGKSYLLTGTVDVVGSKSVVTLKNLASLPAGTYDITYKSAAGSNPVFEGLLMKNYVKTTDPDDSSGGCDAGFAGLALLLATPLFLRKKD